MAATRLSDSQKQEVVARFRAGASSQELSEAFGCSPNTVSRAVKAVLDPAEYERLKRQRGSRRKPDLESDVAAGAAEPQLGLELSSVDPAPPAASGEVDELDDEELNDELDDDAEEAEDDAEEDDDDDGPGMLAIEDAEDFGADDDDEEEEDDDSDEGDDADVFLPIPVALAIDDHAPSSPVPLAAAPLPASMYMLVDKTVELQARPLSDFPELGRLPAEELQRQALVVFANPRQAKRQCGRSQRVIKLPDARVLERTAPYLLAQGISRVVIEGALYSLPGS